MIRLPPRSTRTDTLFPYTTLFRSRHMQFLRMRQLRPGPVITILYPPLLGVLIPLALALIPALLLSLLMPFWAAALIGIGIRALFSGRLLDKLIVRSEERRVGKGCVSTCRSRVSPVY